MAQDAGLTGNDGVIGWYVPKFFADANPDILTAKTDPTVLNKYANQFKTAESGSKGQLLDGDPSYVTNDKAHGQRLRAQLHGRLVRRRDRLEQVDPGGDRPEEADAVLLLHPELGSSKVELVHIELPA